MISTTLQTQSPLTHSIPNTPDGAVLKAENLNKGFTLHGQNGLHLPVLKDISLTVNPGECVALQGPSGSGKSTFMKSLYANYRVDSGAIWIKHRNAWTDLTQAHPHELIDIRQHTIGYVSQFLRVIPRVPALHVAAEPMMEIGIPETEALDKVRSLFTHLNLPERLWSLSPTTFSGGEKQRVNIARAFAVDRPLLLLDEPTAALDAENSAAVIQLIKKKKSQGCALVGIFHDQGIISQTCNRILTF